MKRNQIYCAIITLLFCLLLVSTTNAMNVTQNIYTPEDVNLTNNVYNDGNTVVNINGLEWKYEPEKWSRDRKGTSLKSVSRSLSRVFRTVAGTFKVVSLNEYETNMMVDMINAFVTRIEYNQMIDIMDTRITSLENAFESTNPTAYCQGKVDTMIEKNLSWVICNDTKYYNNNDGSFIVGIRLD